MRIHVHVVIPGTNDNIAQWKCLYVATKDNAENRECMFERHSLLRASEFQSSAPKSEFGLWGTIELSCIPV